MKRRFLLMMGGMLMVAGSAVALELPTNIVTLGSRQGGFWPSGHLQDGEDAHFYLIESNEDGRYGKYHSEVATLYGDGDEVKGYPVGVHREMMVPKWVCLDGKYLPVMGVEGVFERSTTPKAYLHDGIVKIGCRAFAEAEGISELTLPISLQMVSSMAFHNMPKLKEIKFRSPLPPAFEMTVANGSAQILELGGEAPEQLGETPFGATATQVKFYVPKGSKEFYIAHPLFKAMKWEVEEYGPALYHRIKPFSRYDEFLFTKSANYTVELYIYQGKGSDVKIPASLTSEEFEMGISMKENPYEVAGIGESVFYQLADVKDITLPDGIKYVKGCAFDGCGAEKIVADGNLQFVGDRAFAELKNLKTFTLNRSASDMDKFHWAATAFDGINANATLRYYADDVRVDRNALPWSRFSNFEIITASTEGSGNEGSGVDEIKGEAKTSLRVIAEAGLIKVSNDGNIAQRATVATSDGTVIFDGKVKAGAEEILSVTPGVYVIATSTEKIKVIL